jgi:tRNA G18 (ribose-2'-O)-methylase SpoU
MIERIADASDSRLASYASVGDASALERAGLFVAEGRLVVERLLETGRFAVDSVAVTPPAASALGGIFERRPDVPVYVCDPAVMATVTGIDFHRGCIALARRPRLPVPASALVPSVLEHSTCVLALEGVGNPDNVGGLFRTAFAFGVDVVVIDPSTADPLYRKAIRTSMAATLRVPYLRLDPWSDGLDALHAAGLRLVALTPHPDAVALEEYEVRDGDRVVLAVGSEGFGLSRASMARADVRVRIPIEPRSDSLNVVTAAAVALYELRKKVRVTYFDEERGQP